MVVQNTRKSQIAQSSAALVAADAHGSIKVRLPNAPWLADGVLIATRQPVHCIPAFDDELFGHPFDSGSWHETVRPIGDGSRDILFAIVRGVLEASSDDWQLVRV